jgi:hypothetical protein
MPVKVLNAVSYLTISEDQQLYAVIDIAMVRGKQLVGTVLVARLVGDQIYIELVAAALRSSRRHPV